MEKVSIIMPTYNRAEMIADSIESVLNQTYGDFELIVVDDGSTDNTQEIIKQFIWNGRIRYVKQINSGAASARNAGLALRSGNYIAFIDSDDIWEKNKLEIQISVMNQLSDVDIICSDFSAFSKNGKFEKSHIRSYFGVLDHYKLEYEDIFSNSLTKQIKGLENGESIYWGNISSTMMFGNIMLTSTTMFRDSVFQNSIRFDTKYETLEDYDLFLKLTKIHSVAFINKPLMRYRYNDFQLSGDIFIGKLCNNLIDIYNKNINGIEDKEFLRKNKKKIKRCLSRFQAMKAYYHLVNEEHGSATVNYMKSIYNNPFLFKSYLFLLFSLLPKSITNYLRKIKSYLRNKNT